MYKIYGKQDCTARMVAKKILTDANEDVEFVDVAIQQNKDTLLSIIPGVKSVPQIFLDNYHIGGLPELNERLKSVNETRAGAEIKVQLNG